MTSFRWGYVFLQFDMRVPYSQRIHLADQACDMYLNKETSRDVKLESCEHQDGLEGRITTTGKYGVSGSYAGVIYTAEVDISGGTAKLAFLISEQTPGADPLSANLN